MFIIRLVTMWAFMLNSMCGCIQTLSLSLDMYIYIYIYKNMYLPRWTKPRNCYSCKWIFHLSSPSETNQRCCRPGRSMQLHQNCTPLRTQLHQNCPSKREQQTPVETSVMDRHSAPRPCWPCVLGVTRLRVAIGLLVGLPPPPAPWPTLTSIIIPCTPVRLIPPVAGVVVHSCLTSLGIRSYKRINEC